MKKSILIILGIIGLGLFGLNACTNQAPLKPLDHMQSHLSKVNLTTKSSLDDIDLHWVSQHLQENQNSIKPIIIGIHGTPGSWDAWQALMSDEKVQRDYQFIAIDRPGWGKSKARINNQAVAIFDIAQQAELITQLILDIAKKQTQAPIVLVGHSWGGPVVSKIAADNPDLIDGVISIAGPFDPELSKPRWYNIIANNFVISRAIGENLRVSNDEMMPLANQLTHLREDWKKITVPTYIIQGDKDFIVKEGNATYFYSLLATPSAVLKKYPNEGHFIPFNREGIIVDAIEEMLNYLSQN